MSQYTYSAPYPYSQTEGWRPYKGTADKKPKEPPPLGRMPQPGFANPRFPTVGPTEIKPPPGGYQSSINTAPPIDQGRMRQISRVAQQPQSYATGAGASSRAGLSRAMADFSSQTLDRSTDQFNQQYRQQAEKARAEDILAQRQNASDRFQMDVYKAIFGADTDLRYTTGIKDLTQYWNTERWNENAKQTAMWLSFIGGLL
jgi:hypothetical protein